MREKQQLVVSPMHNGPIISLFIRGSAFDVFSLDDQKNGYVARDQLL